MRIRRWDFVAAYLQGELEDGEVVYCSVPQGYATKVVEGKVVMCLAEEGDGVKRICRVDKPVYGMAQAGRRWQRALFPWLRGWRGGTLQQSSSDPCVFFWSGYIEDPRTGGKRFERLYVGCYVDDLWVWEVGGLGR